MCSYSSMDGVLFCKTHFEQLFKETGSFKKNFPTCKFVLHCSSRCCFVCNYNRNLITLYLFFFFCSGAKANNEQSKVPNKYGSVFCGTQDKCAACKKTVYPLEKMTLEGEPYHKTCFKCAHGGCILTTASYASLNGILYCQNHFWQLFKETGSYSNLLKPASKNAEEPEAAKEEEQAPEAVEDQVPEAVEDQEHS
ncbi:LIM domain-containing protein PLIM2b isoform X3 [Aegilops tauschii subsp. strangulata]